MLLLLLATTSWKIYKKLFTHQVYKYSYIHTYAHPLSLRNSPGWIEIETLIFLIFQHHVNTKSNCYTRLHIYRSNSPVRIFLGGLFRSIFFIYHASIRFVPAKRSWWLVVKRPFAALLEFRILSFKLTCQ